MHVPLTTSTSAVASPSERQVDFTTSVDDVQLRAVDLGLDGPDDAANVAGVDAHRMQSPRATTGASRASNRCNLGGLILRSRGTLTRAYTTPDPLSSRRAP